MEHLGDQDGGGAVGGADDADGSCILHIKAQGGGQEDGEENARLSGSAAQEELGVGQQGTKVDHGSNADEQQDGHGLTGTDANLKEPLDNAVGLPHSGGHLVDHARSRQIDQDSAKPHGQEQGGLKAFLNGQPDEQSAHNIHDQLLPGDGQQAFPQKFHVISSLVDLRRHFWETVLRTVEFAQTGKKKDLRSDSERRSGHFRQNQRDDSPMLVGPTAQQTLCRLLPFVVSW